MADNEKAFSSPGSSNNITWGDPVILHGDQCGCVECQLKRALRRISSLECCLRSIKGICVFSETPGYEPPAEGGNHAG